MKRKGQRKTETTWQSLERLEGEITSEPEQSFLESERPFK